MVLQTSLALDMKVVGRNGPTETSLALDTCKYTETSLALDTWKQSAVMVLQRHHWLLIHGSRQRHHWLLDTWK